MNATAAVTDAVTREQIDFASADLSDTSPQPGRASATVYIPRPATVGASATYILGFGFNALASRGWTADFSHTVHLYLPTVEGIAWTADDGAFTEQARPDWAQDATVDYEVATPASRGRAPAAGGLGGGGLRARAPAAARGRAAAR